MNISPKDPSTNNKLNELLATRILSLGDDKKFDATMDEIFCEMVKNSIFLCPFESDDFEYSSESGLAPSSNITFGAIHDDDTTLTYTVVFSDLEKLKTWKSYDDKKRNFLEIGFMEYYDLIKNTDQIAGFILNPYLDHVLITKDYMKELYEREIDDSSSMNSSHIVESIKQYALGHEDISKIWFDDTYDLDIIIDSKQENHLSSIKSIAKAFSNPETKVTVKRYNDLEEKDAIKTHTLIYKKKFKLF